MMNSVLKMVDFVSGTTAGCRLFTRSVFNENPDFLFKNPDFLLRNPDFLLKKC